MLSSIVLVALATSLVAAVPAEFNHTVQKRADGSFSVQSFKHPVGMPNLRRRTVTGTTGFNPRWWITMGIGTPPQYLNFLPDTGANNWLVQSTLMPQSQRGDGLFYDPSKSSTSQKTQYTFTQCFSAGCESGNIYHEVASVGAATFTNNAVEIGVIDNDSIGVANGDRAGNLGLDANYGGQSTTPGGVPSFIQAIAGDIPQIVVAFSYNAYLAVGSMDVGYIDSAKYTGSIGYVNNQQGSTLWNIQFNGIVVNGQTKSIPFVAIVDTGTGGSGNVPRAFLDAYFAQISGATFSSSANTYTYPCSATLPDMVFSVGGNAIHVPAATWQGQYPDGSNRCTCGFSASSDSSKGFLAEGFFEGIYTVFDYANNRVGFANRPAVPTTIPGQQAVGSVKFCTGTNFGGTCNTASWASNSCRTLSGSAFYHNVGSFAPDKGGCTLYSDTACVNPYTDNQNIKPSGKANAGTSGKGAGSYLCLWPADYVSQKGSGIMNICTAANFQGCTTYNWNSWQCKTLSAQNSKNMVSAGAGTSYCYFYTDAGCNVGVEDGTPVVTPGQPYYAFGKKVQSFLCV